VGHAQCIEHGYYTKLYVAVRYWIEKAFPFTRACYSNTEIPDLPGRGCSIMHGQLRGVQSVKSMVVVRRPRDAALLVSRDADAAGNEYERPLGGRVEFGEFAADAACREMREEIGQELAGLRLLGVLENVFELDGVPGHEIVFVFTARFRDETAYDVEEQVILDDASGRVRVRWRDRLATAPPLVPGGIGRMIGSSAGTSVNRLHHSSRSPSWP
jgi:ADP-ribose pyrophosphatase YjhB (NUDIX family)